MSLAYRMLVAGLFLAVPACSRGGRVADPGAAPETAVRVHVTNHYNLEMEIVASGGGVTERLGIVAPGLAREFDVPRVMVGAGAVSFTAQPSGSGPIVRSEEVRIRGGNVVDFEIATNLIGSRATVRL